MLVDQPLPDPPGGMPLLARRVLVRQSASASITAAYGPIAGRGPRGYGLAAAAAPRWPAPAAPSAGAPHAAPPAPGSRHPSSRWSRLICSNSSTLDRATPGPPRRQTDAKIRTRVGPEFATTRRPTTRRESPPRRGQNSRRKPSQPGPVQVTTLRGQRSGSARRELPALRGIRRELAMCECTRLTPVPIGTTSVWQDHWHRDYKRAIPLPE